MAKRAAYRILTAMAWVAGGALLHAALVGGAPAGGEPGPELDPRCPELGGSPPSPPAPRDAEPAACPEVGSSPVPACPPCPATSEAAALPAAEPPGGPPTLPLPRMPGARPMHVDARWDAAQTSWLLVEATEVPVRLEHAVRYYDKAIRDVGMFVLPGPPHEDEGRTRSILRGRRPRDHVQVSLAQQGEEQRTRVRVMWRSWPAQVPAAGDQGHHARP